MGYGLRGKGSIGYDLQISSGCLTICPLPQADGGAPSGKLRWPLWRGNFVPGSI